MMEEETHVVDNMSDHEGICQVLFEAIEDQSEVCLRFFVCFSLNYTCIFGHIKVFVKFSLIFQ